MLGDPLVEDLLLSSTEDGEKLRKKIRRSEKQEQGQNRIFKKTWIITGTTRKHRNPLTKVKVLQKTKLCPKCPGRSESNNVSYYEKNKYRAENIIPCVYNQIILVAQWRQRWGWALHQWHQPAPESSWLDSSLSTRFTYQSHCTRDTSCEAVLSSAQGSLWQ